MRVLAFRHSPSEGLGSLEDAARSLGIECVCADLFRNSSAPVSVDEFDGLMLMGGPMSANDDLPYLRKELEQIDRAVAQHKPVLGVCLGSQLIAKALGAKVYRNQVKEIGWAPVYWTESARADPLFTGLTAPETMFHWHGETFDLPPGAELLAWSDRCRHQTYRVQDNIYGLQFHLEVTPQMITEWCRQDAACGDLREVTTPIEPHENSARLAELSEMVFGRWCRLLRVS